MVRVKLTGIIEVQVEVETEIVDLDHFYEWCRGPAPMEDIPGLYLKYLREFTDEETEIWSSVPPLDRDSYILTAEFVEAEVPMLRKEKRMRKHFVLGGKGGEAWLTCPKHDDLFMQATGSSGFSTDEDCIGCLAAEQAWDEGRLVGWTGNRKDNPYREGRE